jgi:uncharacterized protein
MIGKRPTHHRATTEDVPRRDPGPSVYFDVDGMLGHLAKWLRTLGFDAAHPISSPRPGRWFVTTRMSLRDPHVIVVAVEKGRRQLHQTLEQAGLKPDPDLIFSRCIVCNVPVQEIEKELVRGRVPDKVFGAVDSFHYCDACGRVYWEGSHLERAKKRLIE